jgi:CheY-like chemotaxis protein
MTKAKVLLADASEFCLELLKDFLKHSQVQTFTSGDGPGAIRQARKLRPDLVVLDWGLPAINGLDCCRTIREEQALSAVPVILLLPAGQEQAHAACLATGCNAVLHKPLDRSHFLEVGRTFLERIERRLPRIRCRATVACRFAQGTFFGTIEDISPQGMFIGSSHPVKSGDPLRIKFLLPWQEGRLIETAARVTWTQGPRGLRKNNLPQGFGLTFEGLADREVDSLREFIAQNLLRHQHLEL